MMFKLIKNHFKEICVVHRVLDNAFIPFDPANTDYQAYLKWLEAGNVPEQPDAQE